MATATATTVAASAQRDYDLDDLADLFGSSRRHVERLASAGELPGLYRVGRLVRFQRAAIDQWLARGGSDSRRP
jgi:excisionase family DNA binding protein